MMQITYSSFFSFGFITSIVLDFYVQVKTTLTAVYFATFSIGTLKQLSKVNSNSGKLHSK